MSTDIKCNWHSRSMFTDKMSLTHNVHRHVHNVHRHKMSLTFKITMSTDINTNIQDYTTDIKC